MVGAELIAAGVLGVLPGEVGVLGLAGVAGVLAVGAEVELGDVEPVLPPPPPQPLNNSVAVANATHTLRTRRSPDSLNLIFLPLSPARVPLAATCAWISKGKTHPPKCGRTRSFDRACFAQLAAPLSLELAFPKTGGFASSSFDEFALDNSELPAARWAEPLNSPIAKDFGSCRGLRSS